MAENKFNISDFKSSFKKGLASPNLFHFFPGYGGKDLMMKVKSAQIPDMNIQTFQHSYAGIPIKYPWENATSDITLSIICSSDLKERDIFVNWQDLIIDYMNTDRSFTVAYPNDYQFDSILGVYDLKQELVMEFTFEKSWPINVGPVELDWSSKDEIMTFDVTLSYSYWSSTKY